MDIFSMFNSITLDDVIYILMLSLAAVLIEEIIRWHRIQYKGMSKEEKKEYQSYQKKRHRMAMVTVFFKDNTYLTQQIDVEKVKGKLSIADFEYELPSMPMKVRGWWPFKARTFKSFFFPDAHYNIDFIEGISKALDINYQVEGDSHYLHPMTYTSLVNEKGHSKMMSSIKKKKAVGLDRKWMAIIIIVIIVAAVLILSMTGAIKL